MHKLLLWLLSFFAPPLRSSHTRASSPEPLSNRDRQDLVSVREMPGYDIIMKLAEEECESFATELINTNPANKEEVLARHSMTKSAWQFFLRLQKRIEFETNEVAVNLNPAQGVPDLDDPAVLGRLVDPLAINL